MRWLASLLLAGCAGGAPGVVAHDLDAVEFPSYEERLVLYATNRARVDPAAEGWAQFPARPPLAWNYDLNRSARAHSLDMRNTPCFQHNSCDGTGVFQRIRSYYTGDYRAMGENIAAGPSDGRDAVHNWIEEIGAPPGETGHRENIFSPAYTLLGVGFAPGGSRFRNYWTQDFVGTTVSRPRLIGGIHFPAGVPSGGSATFGITYEDPSGRGPALVEVIVEADAYPLALARGSAAQGAYEAALALPDGCHAYSFHAVSPAGESSYPSTGVLQVGFGDSGAGCAGATAGEVGSTGPGVTHRRAGCEMTGVPEAGGWAPLAALLLQAAWARRRQRAAADEKGA